MSTPAAARLEVRRRARTREASQSQDPPDLPHDLEAEQAVLGAILIDGPAVWPVVRDLVPADAFYLRAHQLVFGACARLTEDDVALEPVAVHSALAADIEAGHVPGDLPFGLAKGIGTAANVSHYAALIARLARERAEILAARDFERAPGADARAAARGRLLATLAEAPGPRVLDLPTISIGAALTREEEQLERGVERIPTGWRRLDEALGGGLAVPSLTVLGAPPKSGKSTWTQTIAVRHVEAGGVAYVLDLENGGRRVLRQILCRRAELGPRDAARALADEHAGVFASREAAERWRGAKTWLKETLGPGLYVEHTPPHDLVARVAAVRQAAGTRKLLLVVDSLQKLPGDPREDRRTTIDRWTRLFERLRYEYEAAILVVSEIRRGREGYAAREDAFKESGGIEYAADLAMTLNRPAADEDADAPTTLRVELARDCEEDPRGEVASYRAVRPWYGLEEVDPVPIARVRRSGPAPEKRAAAGDFLRTLLAGPVHVREIFRRGKAEGFSENTLRRAKEEIGAISCTLTGASAWRMA